MSYTCFKQTVRPSSWLLEASTPNPPSHPLRSCEASSPRWPRTTRARRCEDCGDGDNIPFSGAGEGRKGCWLVGEFGRRHFLGGDRDFKKSCFGTWGIVLIELRYSVLLDSHSWFVCFGFATFWSLILHSKGPRSLRRSVQVPLGEVEPSLACKPNKLQKVGFTSPMKWTFEKLVYFAQRFQISPKVKKNIGPMFVGRNLLKVPKVPKVRKPFIGPARRMVMAGIAKRMEARKNPKTGWPKRSGLSTRHRVRGKKLKTLGTSAELTIMNC